jgi:hypothetical protein
MRNLLTLAATLSFALAAQGAPAFAQTLDKAGRCHLANGQFAKADVCKGARGIAPAAAAGPVYKLDAKGKCRDAKGKMAKKALCKA